MRKNHLFTDHRIKKAIALTAAAALVLGTAACGTKGSEAQTSQTSQTSEGGVRVITVAHTQSYVPYDYIDENGNHEGYEVAVLKAVDELLPQYEFVYEGTTDDDLLIGVESGKYQIGTKGVWWTAARSETYVFPEHYIGASIIGLTLEDLEKIQPLEEDNEWFAKSVELAKGYREIYGDDILIFYNFFAPLTQLRSEVNRYAAKGNLHRDVVLEFLTQDAKAVARALDVIAEDVIRLIKRVVSEGICDGIYLSVTNPNRKIPADIYSLFIAPSEKKILAAANELSEYNILHICGYEGNKNILSVYQDYDVKVVNWAVHAEQFGLKEGKKLFGGRAVIGGFDQTKDSVLYRGSKEEIEAYVEKLIEDVGKVGVVVGADCTVPADISVERLNWARNKAKELS